MIRTKLLCPKCRGQLKVQSAKTICAVCATSYPTIDGVIDLAPEQAYAYEMRSVSKDALLKLVDEARRGGWTPMYRRYIADYFNRRTEPTGLRRRLRDIYKSLSGRTVPGVFHAVSCESQAHAWLLTALSPESAVLDLGAGWSRIAHAWAGECHQLVAADATLSRLQFSALRAAENKSDNMQFVRIPTTPALPFADGSFDVVLINGVLEWMPASAKGDPYEVQLDYLREVLRILRPGGQVLVGIENRFSFSDILGFPEGHVGLPWVGILPRFLGDLYSRMLGRGPLRVMTHSARGLRGLLVQSGFAAPSIRIFAPQPTYAWFDVIGSIDSQAGKIVAAAHLSQHPLFRRHMRGLSRFVLAPFARNVGAFYAVAGKTMRASALEEIVSHVATESGIQLQLPVSNLRIKETKVLFSACIEGIEGIGGKAHVAVALTPEGASRVNQEATMLRIFEACSTVKASKVQVPSVMYLGRFRGHPVSVLRDIPGTPLGATPNLSARWSSSLAAVRGVRAIGECLSGTSGFGTVMELWDRRWCFLLTDCVTEVQRRRILGLETQLRPAVEMTDTSAVFGHGDLLPGNILACEDGALGIIDWEACGAKHPLEDAITCMLGHGRARHRTFAKTVVWFIRNSTGGPPPGFEVFLQDKPTDNATWLIGLVMAWLGHLESAKGTYLLLWPGWYEDNVWPVLDAIEESFAAGKLSR